MTEPRQVLEEYRLERVMTMTPASTVFAATSPGSDETVALKILSAAGVEPDEARIGRFLKWVAGVSRLELEALPEVVDLGQTPDGSGFLVSRMIPCEPVESLAGGDPARVLALLLQGVEALSRLAEAGFAHHNLSPDNLMVEDGRRLRILGLGTAAFFGTEGGTLIGHSPAWDRYAAPELLDLDIGRGSPPWRADLYTFSLVACELLGAQVEEAGSSRPEVRLPPPLHERTAGARELETILADALRFDPATRTVDWGFLADALAGCVADLAGDRDDGEAGVDDLTAISSGEPAAVQAAFDPNQTNPMLIPEQIGAEPLEAEAAAPQVGETRATGALPLPEAVEATVVKAQGVPPAPPPWAAVLERGTRLAREAGRRVAALPPRILVAAAAVVLVGAAVWTVVGSRTAPAPPPEPTPPPPTAVPTPAVEAVPVLHPTLAEAELLVDAGDLESVRSLLDGISEEEIDAFTEEDRAVYDRLLETLEGLDLSQALVNLRRGLEVGSIDRLHRALRVLGSLEDPAAQDPEVSRDVERARQAIRLHTLLWRAQRADDHAQVLERAADLMDALPAYTGAAKLRREAAAALEKQAEAAASARSWDRALDRLEALRRAWPDRPGLNDRIRELEAARDRERRFATAIGSIRATGEGGDPEGALAALAELETPPGLGAEVDALRQELLDRLAAMDESPPTIRLGGEADLAFRKNREFVVPLLIEDDYRVERAFAMVRPESLTDYRELPLVRGEGDRWQLEVPPALHANEDVLFYVVAVDRSGHRGTLGSAEEPVRADRKRWWQR